MTSKQLNSRGGWACAAAALLFLTACSHSSDEDLGTESEQALAAVSAVPRGLAIEIENGAGVPLAVRAGQTFYINQIDLRVAITATRDEGVEGLRTRGAASNLAWAGVYLADEEPLLLQNSDLTYTRRRFYLGAAWMNTPSTFVLQQLDATGQEVATPISVGAGRADQRAPSDDFFIRRMRAIQWAYDCPALDDCTGADNFAEEALVELRNAMHPEQTFAFAPTTTKLRVRWSLDPSRPYDIPVQQVTAAPYDYGFQIDVAAVTPPQSNGTYSPGQPITFQLTLKDDSGNRLHPPGSLPTYNEATFGPNPAGIYYYRGFTDPSATYYRRKHRERNFLASIIGPLHKVQPIRSVVGLEQFFAPSLAIGSPSRDGVYAEGVLFPQGLFAGGVDPTHAAWNLPQTDTFTFRLPPDAEPGTYTVTVKARRAYLGEDIPRTKNFDIQVGTTQATTATFDTGPCNTCHTGPSSLAVVNHANADRATCATCHAPLAFELEGPISVRTHFIHSRGRFDAPLSQCSKCHLTAQSIQRTSKAACLSCHRSYPDSHVQTFGAITSAYIGGGVESFDQCTDACHQAHPGSGL